jgi:CBS domain-containing protein
MAMLAFGAIPAALLGTYHFLVGNKPMTDAEKEMHEREQLEKLQHGIQVGGARVSLALLPEASKSREQAEADSAEVKINDGQLVAKYFAALSVSQVAVPKGVIVLDAKMNLAGVLRVLADKRISSAPVAVDDGGEQKLIGFVSLLTVVGRLVDILREQNVGGVVNADQDAGDAAAAAAGSSDAAGGDAAAAYAKFGAETLEQLHESGKLNARWSPVYEDDSALTLLTLFGRGTRRAPVFRRVQIGDALESESRVNGLVSQSDIVALLAKRQHTTLFGLARKSLAELNFHKPREHLLVAALDHPVADCFATMAEFNVSAVALVDDDNKLVGQLTSTHLKGLTLDTCASLSGTAGDFVQAASNEGGMARHCFTLQHSLSKVLLNLRSRRAHRVWLVDDEGHLVGLLSLADIIRGVLELDVTDPSLLKDHSDSDDDNDNDE